MDESEKGYRPVEKPPKEYFTPEGKIKPEHYVGKSEEESQGQQKVIERGKASSESREEFFGKK